MKQVVGVLLCGTEPRHTPEEEASRRRRESSFPSCLLNRENARGHAALQEWNPHKNIMVLSAHHSTDRRASIGAPDELDS